MDFQCGVELAEEDRCPSLVGAHVIIFFFSSAIDINGLTAMRRKDHFFTKHRDYRDEFVETFTTRTFFCQNIICT